VSRVLIVSRTRMNQGRVCVGGHDLDDDFRSLRLLTKTGMNLREDLAIAPGEVWELEYVDHEEPDPPHVEDVLVDNGKRVETFSPEQVRALITEHDTPWTGPPDVLFDGLVTATPNGRVYVPGGDELPSRSTGYWIPDAELIKRVAFERAKFFYTGDSELDEFTWAGMAEPPDRIPAGTLVRVSLARWFSPASAPAGYYVQISGVH
jgi:hypothetical protein